MLTAGMIPKENWCVVEKFVATQEITWQLTSPL